MSWLGLRSFARVVWYAVCALTVSIAAVALPVVVAPSARAVVLPPAPVNPDPAVRVLSDPGPTFITAHITEDTVWGPQGSPYVVEQLIYVRPSASLTILPGTVVKLSGYAGISVQGQILVLGEPGSRVIFTSLLDDSVGGDTNGDGSATSPAPGDWGGIGVSHDSNAKTVPMSVIDYADVRFGAKGPTNTLGCMGENAVAVAGNGRLVLSNSKVSDFLVNGVGVGTDKARGYAGVFNNEISDGRCGISVVSATGDFVGNKLTGAFGRASVGVLDPKKVRLWFNDFSGNFWGAGVTSAPTRDELDVRFNTISGTRGAFGAAKNQLADYSLNWWGRDLSTDPVPTECLASGDTFSPSLVTEYDHWGCPEPNKKHRATGYAPWALPALSEAPGDMPSVLAAGQVPMFGPVDTFNGRLKYSQTDLVVQDAGKQIEVSRVFDAEMHTGDLGDTWRSSFSEQVSSMFGYNSLVMADGSAVPFPQDIDAGGVATRGVSASGSYSPLWSHVTTPDRTTMTFDGAGELNAVYLGDMEHRLDIDRVAGKVSKVTGISGRFVEYDRSGGKLREVTDSQGRTVEYSYDSAGHLSSVKDVDGQTTSYEYVGDKLKKVTLPSGVVELEVGYDSSGRVEWIREQGQGRADISYDSAFQRTITLANDTEIVQKTDSDGRLVSERVGDRSSRHIVYDGEGRVVSEITGIPTVSLVGYGPISTATMFDERGNPQLQVDGTGRGTMTTFNSKHQPTKVVDSAGNTTTYDYDSNDRLVAMSDASGDWEFENNSRGQRTKTTDPAGRIMTASYNSGGDRVSETNEFGGETTFTVDAYGRTTSATDADNNERTFTYTSWGQLAGFSLPAGGTYSAAFDVDQRPVTVTDPLNKTTTYSYDVYGRLNKVTDGLGGQTQLTYDGLGRVVSAQDARGKTTTQEFTDDGLVESITNAAGETTEFEYDPAGRRLRETDPLGRVTQTVYDRSGRIVKVQTPDGGTRSFEYDANGNQSKVIAADGGIWLSEYDDAGNVTKTTDPLGKVNQWTYDAARRVVSHRDARDHVTTFAYTNGGKTRSASDGEGSLGSSSVNALGQVVSQTDPRGNTSTYAYNADGLLARVTAPDGGVSEFGWDVAGRQISQSNPAGGTVGVSYDALGRIVSKQFPDTSTESYVYDPVGNLIEFEDRTGGTWEYAFDNVNRPVSQTDPLNGETTLSYDAAGLVTQMVDPSGVQTQYAYDPVGRLAVVTDALDASWVYVYDLEGRNTSETNPAGVQIKTTFNTRGEATKIENAGASGALTFTYDAAGNLTKQVRSNRTLEWTYDTRGNLATSKDARGNITSHSYDLAGNRTSTDFPDNTDASWTFDDLNRVESATNGAGDTSSYTYDVAGNVTEIELPGGGVFEFGFDNQGRMTSQTDPLNNTTSYTWTPAGQLAQTQKPSGKTVTSTFDALGRETTRTAGLLVREFEYDPAGRMTSASGGGRTLEYVYDSRGLLAEASDHTGTTEYTRDSSGRVTGVDAPGGASTTYAYNNQGLVSSMRGTTNLNLGYDAHGQLTQRTNVNPTKNAATTYGYDADGNVTSFGFGGKISFATTFDSMGRVSSVSKDHQGVSNPLEGTHEYSYDEAGRIASWTLDDGTNTSTTSYEWDEDSNRVSQTVDTDPAVETTFDAAGRRISDSDGTTYSYDVDGSLTGVDVLSGPDRVFSYNDFGELSSAQVGSDTATYEFDPFGRIASRIFGWTFDYGYDAVHGGVSSVSADGAALIFPVVSEPGGTVVSVSGLGQIQHFGVDGQGNTVGTTDNDASGLVSTLVFDPFGVPTDSGWPALTLGFQSDLTDPVVGLVAMGARTYLPDVGGFTSPDTVVGDLREPVSLNRYTYGFGDPVSMFDPDGHWPSWSKLRNAFTWVKDRVSATVKSVTGWVSSAGSRVKQATSSLVNRTRQATQNAKSEIAKLSRQTVAAAARFDQNVNERLGFTPGGGLTSQQTHMVLAGVGLIPVVGEVADAADAVLYLIEGDTTGALLSMASLVPVAGGAAGLAKLGRQTDTASSVLTASAKTTRGPPATNIVRNSTNTIDAGAASVRATRTNIPTTTPKPGGYGDVGVVRGSQAGSRADSFVYRGVAIDHPGYADALRGRVFPRNPNGLATPAQHNLGQTVDSPFTSWSREPSIAGRFAGEGGVVLRVPTGKPPRDSSWKFEWSPDAYFEQEVLIRGPVIGAERYR